MADQPPLVTAVFPLRCDHSRGSSGTEDSTLPISPHYSDFETSSDMTSSQKSARSHSPASSLLEENLEFLENVWTPHDGTKPGVLHLPGNAFSLPGSHQESFIPEIDSKFLIGSPQGYNRGSRSLDFSLKLEPDDVDTKLDSLDRDLFRPVSGTSSRQSSPRGPPRGVSTPRSSGMPSPGMARMLRAMARDSERACSPDATTLYGTRAQHYNPAGYGQHALEERMEYSQWANGFLKYSPHQTSIMDLPRDFADGLTLLHLVEMLLGTSVHPIHVKPALEVQRTENIQVCLDVLSWNGVNVGDISVEDIVKGNTKVVLAFCKLLRSHFGSSPGTPVLLTRSTSPRAQEQRFATRRLRSPGLQHQDRRTSPSSRPLTPSAFAVLDREDLALLNWINNVTRTKVADYDSFQDGHALCLLVNYLSDEDTIPLVVLQHGLPSEKISLALEVAREELRVETDLTSDEVRHKSNPDGLATFLKRLHRVFIDKLAKKQEEMEKVLAEEMFMKTKELEEKESGVLRQFKQKHDKFSSTPVKTESRSSLVHKPTNNGTIETKGDLIPRTLHDGILQNVNNKRSEGTSLSEYFTNGIELKPNLFGGSNNEFIAHKRREDFKTDGYISSSLDHTNASRNTGANVLDTGTNYFGDDQKGPSYLSSGTFEKDEAPSSYFLSNEAEKRQPPFENRTLSENKTGSRKQEYYFYDEFNSRNRPKQVTHPAATTFVVPETTEHRQFDPESSLFEQIYPRTKQSNKSPSKLDVGVVIPKLEFPSGSLFKEEALKVPFTGKSNKALCETAKLKLTEYNRQLELLRLQYFDTMKGGISEEPQQSDRRRNSLPVDLPSKITPEDIVPNMEIPSMKSSDEETLSPEVRMRNDDNVKRNRHMKSLSTGRIPTHYVQSSSDGNKGSFPPYRTWSVFVSDNVQSRQNSNSHKTTPVRGKNGRTSSRFEDVRGSSGGYCWSNTAGSCTDQIMHPSSDSTKNGTEPPIVYYGHMDQHLQYDVPDTEQDVSKPKTTPLAIQSFQKSEAKSLNSEAGRDKDRNHVTNPLQGLTAFIRLTAKKANAVSDTH